MEAQLASARVLLLAAAVPVAVFLCLRAAGLDVGPALGGRSSAPSSDVQVVAEFTAPVTSADDLFDRRAGTRATVTLGPVIGEPQTTTRPGAKAGGSGSGGSSGSGAGGDKNNIDGGGNGGGGTNPTPPPPPGLLQPVQDALKPVTDATGTGPVVDEVAGTVEGTLDDVTAALPETPSLP